MQETDRLTEEHFLKWLRAAATHLSQTRPWPLGATRFNYFRSEVIPSPDIPLSDGTARPLLPAWTMTERDLADFESSYKQDHESGGDPQAIFEFARDNREALRRDWVIEQLIAWRLSGTAIGKQKFDRFMRAYWSEQGMRKPATMLSIIKRDQLVYRDYIRRDRNRQMKVVLSEISEAHGMSIDNVKDVLKEYKNFYPSWRRTQALALSFQKSADPPTHSIRNR